MPSPVHEICENLEFDTMSRRYMKRDCIHGIFVCGTSLGFSALATLR